MTSEPTPETARRALAAVRERKAASSKRLNAPWWYDPVLGGAVAVLMLQAAVPLPWNVFPAALGCIVIALTLRHYTSQDVWVNGWRRGKTLPVNFAYMAGFLALYGFAFGGKHLLGLGWAPYASAAGAFIGMFIFNRVWMAVWRREMEQDQ